MSSIVCKSHPDEAVTSFCYQHGIDLCHKCLADKHQDCRPVKPIANASKNQNDAVALETLEKSMRDLRVILDRMFLDQDNNVADLKGKHHIIKKTIKEARDRINTYLDKLVKRIDLEYKMKQEQLLQRIKKNKDKIKPKKEAMNYILDGMNAVKYKLSDTQLHNEIYSLQIKQKALESEINKMELDEKHFELHLKLDECVLGFEKVFLTMGRIEISERPMKSGKDLQQNKCNVSLDTKMLADERRINCIETSSLTLISSFPTSKLGKGVKVFRACFLPNNTLMLAGYQEKSLYVCNKMGDEGKKIRIANFPGGVSLFNRTHALVSAWQHGIQKFEIENLKAGNILKLQGECSAISSFGNQICVKNGNDHLTIIDINGKVIRKMPTMHNPWEIHLNDTGSVFYSNLDNSDVFCVFPDGSNYLSYSSPDLLDPAGLTVDNQENLYVTGSRSNNIHRISKNRDTKEIVLTKDDDIQSPSGIAFNKQTNELLIVNEDFSSIRVYKVHTTDF